VAVCLAALGLVLRGHTSGYLGARSCCFIHGWTRQFLLAIPLLVGSIGHFTYKRRPEIRDVEAGQKILRKSYALIDGRLPVGEHRIPVPSTDAGLQR
jgi:hypothetical protein